MKKQAKYIGLAAIVVLIVAGVVVFTVVRRKPGTPSGSAPKVTPVASMRVETAEPEPHLSASTYKLKVSGLVNQPVELSLQDVKALPPVRRAVTLPCVEGWSEYAFWKGARLQDVLSRAGIETDARTVVFADPTGYSTSLTVDDVQKTDPILAYEVNGQQLPQVQDFPVRLVVPHKLGYKWIKWVTSIKLIKGNYSGYWESRGYSNSADAP